MIILAATAAAMLYADTVLADNSTNAQHNTQRWAKQSCAAAHTSDEIKQCLDYKLQNMQQMDHEDMWDPNWISAVQPVVESESAEARAKMLPKSHTRKIP